MEFFRGRNKITVSIIVVLILVALGLAWFIFDPLKYVYQSNSVKNLAPSPSLESSSQATQSSEAVLDLPTPAPLAQGSQSYSVGMPAGPIQMYAINASTIDPKNGGTQKIDVKIKDSQADIRSVTAVVKTDKKNESHSMSLSGGTARDGTWTGSWKISDSYDKNFQITFKMDDEIGTNATIDFTIR